MFVADLHIHSKYSRATARNLDLENLFIAAQLNGLNDAAMDDVADEYAAAAALLGQYDPSNVEAKAKDGVLTLTIPKREEAKPKSIKVKIESK